MELDAAIKAAEAKKLNVFITYPNLLWMNKNYFGDKWKVDVTERLNY